MNDFAELAFALRVMPHIGQLADREMALGTTQSPAVILGRSTIELKGLTGMAADTDTLTHARWVLERNLHWIGAAEVKIGVVIAIDTGLLGSLAAALNGNRATDHVYQALFCSFVAAVFLVLAMICAAMTVLPRVTGPPSSMIFFAPIAAKSQADFTRQFSEAKSTDFLTDCLAQIHRNAEIACVKFKWVRKAMWYSFLAAPFWAVALMSLVRA